MNPEEVMKLFDSCWSERQIFTKQPNPSKPSSFEANPDSKIQEKPSKPELLRIPTLHTRSMSDQLSSKTSFASDSLSPKSVLLAPKLDTILSGKEVKESKNPKQRAFELSSKKKFTRSMRKIGESKTKSLSDLEFEELKGFMDLGFVFSEEDRDSKLASVVPGLHRLGKKDGEEEAVDESAIPRPYLSEAWEVLERRERENPLMNWGIPSFSNETDMKDKLRWWAQAVASTVR
ncbi:hypothetical protein FCV25MIE_32953 [Fagus crenata]